MNVHFRYTTEVHILSDENQFTGTNILRFRRGECDFHQLDILNCDNLRHMHEHSKVIGL